MNDQTTGQGGDAVDTNPPVVLHAKAHKKTGEVEWGLGFHPDPPAKFKVNVDLRRRSGGHDFQIHLAGNTDGIRFDESDPIWVSETWGCPPPEGSKSSQIIDVQCSDRLLTFHNKNTVGCVLTYQLNFVGAEPLDPMIRNGGF